MAWNLTIEEINEYKAAFSLFDKNSTGELDTEDMGVLMRSLGQNFSDKDLKRITEEIDSNGNGTIELHEFLNLMAANRKTNEDQANLMRAFKYFDRDDEGTIDFQEFTHVLSTVSEKLTPTEIEAIKNVADVDTNGRLNYKDFARIMVLK
jgi:calmodulin